MRTIDRWFPPRCRWNSNSRPIWNIRKMRPTWAPTAAPSTTARASRRPWNVVEPGAVVPEDLPLARVRERELEEDVGRLGKVRVRVRIVRREDERVVAESLDHPLHLILVGIDADEALALEVLAGRRLQLRRLAALRHLPVLVEPPEEPRQPAAVALEERDAQAREALEDAAGRHRGDGGHQFDWIVEPAGDGRARRREVAVDEVRVGVVVRRRMKADRDVQALGLGPERIHRR